MYKSLLDVLEGRRQTVPPVWLMRQAGRYLSEYRAIREKAGSVLDLCFSPELAAEVTLQPVRRFGFDAAILFSDILVVPHALGRSVRFTAGEGPQLEPLDDPAAIANLRSEIDQATLAPVYRDRANWCGRSCRAEVTLLGFCGGPWTVATYMIAGHGTPEQAPARLFAYRHPEAFARLIDILVEASTAYLVRQFQAGVDAVQMFDTWAGVLPQGEFRALVYRTIAAHRRRSAACGARREGNRFSARRRHRARALHRGRAGRCGRPRLDDRPRFCPRAHPDPPPGAGQPRSDRAARRRTGARPQRGRYRRSIRGGPFIFNLGHGILPDTPIAHVEQMLKRIRG